MGTTGQNHHGFGWRGRFFQPPVQSCPTTSKSLILRAIFDTQRQRQRSTSSTGSKRKGPTLFPEAVTLLCTPIAGAAALSSAMRSSTATKPLLWNNERFHNVTWVDEIHNTGRRKQKNTLPKDSAHVIHLENTAQSSANAMRRLHEDGAYTFLDWYPPRATVHSCHQPISGASGYEKQRHDGGATCISRSALRSQCITRILDKVTRDAA